ncbi:MAG: hypothetical protein Q4C56_05615 [Peptococcaceae bacterium]|nr:hypothetical protein [Peptococcaceae bacterium]
MRHRGNMLVLTLVVCGLLALLLSIGVEILGIQTAVQKNRLAVLQMEQLHRTAVQKSLDVLNAGEAAEDIAPTGNLVYADEPLPGQRREVTSEGRPGRLLTLQIVSRLDNGARTHHIQCLILEDAARLAPADESWAVFYGGTREVTSRWLAQHAGDNALVVSRNTSVKIGSSAAPTAAPKSLYVTAQYYEPVQTILQTDLDLSGDAIFCGDLSLRGNLSCKTAWIDGTLTLSEDAELHADAVYLGEDVGAETLAKIDATIYMPHPPEGEEYEDIHPLPERERADGERFFLLQQLD